MADSGQQKFVHHGNSVAAWSLVAILSVGALMMAVAVGAKSLPLGLVGLVVVVAGVVVGKVLQMSGFGIKQGSH
jgi:hypothetical protein